MGHLRTMQAPCLSLEVRLWIWRNVRGLSFTVGKTRCLDGEELIPPPKQVSRGARRATGVPLVESTRVHSPRLAASASYRRKPVSRKPDWIPCQARNDGPEQKTIPRGKPRGSSFGRGLEPQRNARGKTPSLVCRTAVLDVRRTTRKSNISFTTPVAVCQIQFFEILGMPPNGMRFRFLASWLQTQVTLGVCVLGGSSLDLAGGPVSGVEGLCEIQHGKCPPCFVP